MAMACVQIGLLLTICCSAGIAEKSADTGNEIPDMQQKLVLMNRQEKTLQQEYSLARSSAPYLVVHASSGEIELKARGRILRTFQVKEITRWEPGTSDDVTWIVAEMRPIQISDRPKIKPGGGEAATAEAAKQNPWGLDRMPLDFDLVCSERNILEVRGMPSERPGFGFVKSVKTAYRRSLDRYRRWRAPRSIPLQHVIQLWLDENDSRLLFWSLPKQIKILVFSQPAVLSPSS